MPHIDTERHAPFHQFPEIPGVFMPLLGYSDRLSAAPGTELSFLVSTSEPSPYSAQLVRFHGIDQTTTPIAAREEVIGSAADGAYAGRYQVLRTGSYLTIPTPGAPASSGFALTLWCMPTAPGGRTQVLFETEPARDEGRFVLSLDDAGHLQVELTDRAGRLVCLRWPTPVTAGQWIHIQSEIGHDSVRLSIRTAADESNPDPQRFWVSQHLPRQWSFRPEAITFAGTVAGDNCFNGKIENPALYTSITAMNDGGEALAYWDFSRGISSDAVIDRGPHRWHGILVNRPTRAIVGHAWDRVSVRYTDDPMQWNAIHFHDDDLDDACWSADFTFSVPDLPSGIYAFKLTQDAQTEYLPFYVLAPTPGAKVLFIAPTNTYAAYASEHLWEGERGEAHAKLMRGPIALDKAEVILESTRVWVGPSTTSTPTAAASCMPPNADRW
ncbi:LamG domain-containing protein [Rhodococcus opacus]|nr:LamG domain-containing protein [Rhodococcus opacus]